MKKNNVLRTIFGVENSQVAIALRKYNVSLQNNVVYSFIYLTITLSWLVNDLQKTSSKTGTTGLVNNVSVSAHSLIQQHCQEDSLI